MRTVSVALGAHYATGRTQLAWGLKITRVDAQMFAFTSHPVDITVDGIAMTASAGLDVASIESAAGFAVGNTELKITADDITFTVASLRAGLWDRAAFELFQFNWADPSKGRDVHMAGHFGDVRSSGVEFAVELRDLRQFLQQPVGSQSTKNCRAELGDARCRKPLGPLTVTGSVTTLVSQQAFQDSTRTEADDWFGNGILTFTSGNSNGISFRVKEYSSATKQFTLLAPAVLPIQVGDTFSVIAGCRARLEEDCRLKHNNVLNFYGEPHRPTVDAVMESPEVNV